MGGSYINGGVMDDPKTSIDLDQEESNRAIFQGAKYRERSVDENWKLYFKTQAIPKDWDLFLNFLANSKNSPS